MQGVDIDSLLNSGLDLDNLGFPPSSFAGDFSAAAAATSLPSSLSSASSASVGSSFGDLSPGPSPGLSADSSDFRARSLLERETQAQGLGREGEAEVDLDDQFDVYHRTKTEHVRLHTVHPLIYHLLRVPSDVYPPLYVRLQSRLVVCSISYVPSSTPFLSVNPLICPCICSTLLHAPS